MAVERCAFAGAAAWVLRTAGPEAMRPVWLVTALVVAMETGCGSSGPSAPANLAYPVAAIHGTIGQAISPDTPTISGAVNSYSISPNLPAGLAINASSGVISGTPSAASAQASYTVSAQNSAGSTTATLQVTVTVAAPANLSYPQAAIAATAGLPILPDIPVVTGMQLSFSISPALPAGLSLDAATGRISGSAAGAAAQTAFTVTAQNPGGATTATVNISVMAAPNTLLDLGHAQSIQAIRFGSGRVLSVDQPGHWVFWNYTSGAILADGDGSPSEIVSGTQVFALQQIDMQGTIFVVAIPNGLEIYSTADGHLLSILIYPGIGVAPSSGGAVPWWQLASDGSYIAIGSNSGLAIFSPAGQVLASKTGDYSTAQSFSAPGNVLVALGSAGQTVIETISASTGSSTTSPSFSGQFHSWFLDGARFLTNEQNTVWVYSSAGSQQAVVSLPSIENLTGQGNWVWTYAASTPGYPGNIYAIGSETPALTFSGAASSAAVASGNTFAILAYGAGQLSVYDLSGSAPSRSDYDDPVAYLTTYASDSSGHWVVGNQHGALVDGSSLAGTPRYLGYGQAWSIAGSTVNAAVSTASGKILVFDPAAAALDQTIGFSSSKVAVSTDGTLLGAMGNDNDAQYEADRTLNFYALPAGSVVKSYPYTFQDGQPALFDFSLSGSGGTIAQTIGTFQNALWTWLRKITPLTGSPVIWSDSPVAVGPQPPTPAAPILLSPDGTLADVYTGGSANTYATDILKNGALVTAIPGVAVGWIDNNRILVNQYSGTQYTGAVIYDATGAKGATPALPELKSIQAVTSDSVYDPSHNAIYSLTTGQPTWTGTYPSSGLGAVAGTHVVYESGHKIVMESY